MNAADFLAQMQALLPPGKAWGRAADAIITKVLEGFAPEFARVQDRADTFLLEANPVTAVEMLDEHEYVLGLPDPCSAAPTTTEARQAAIAARLLEGLGHNDADYVAIAVAFGHFDTEITRRPFVPFAAGDGAAGEPLYGDDWAHVYFVGYLENIISDPNDIGSGWTDHVSTNTVDDDVARAPDGTMTADRINFGAAAAAWGFPVVSAEVPPDETQFSVWLKSESGIVSIVLTLEADAASASLDVDVDETWTRHVLRFQSDDTSYVATIGIDGASPESILAWGARLATVDSTFECRLNTIQQAHSLAYFGDIEEVFPGVEYFVVDEAGDFVTDEDGLLVTTVL